MNWAKFNEEYNKYPLSHISTWYHKYVLQPFIKITTFLAYTMNLTPNFLTTLSFIIILMGMAVLLWSPYSLTVKIMSMLFLQLGFIIDCADGHLARIQKRTSLFGAFFDPFIDRVNNFVIFTVYGVLWFAAHPAYLNYAAIILYVAASSSYIFFTLAMLIQGYVFTDHRGAMQRMGKNLIENIIKLPYQFMNMGVHFLLLSLGYIFSCVYQVVVFYGVLGFLHTLVLILYLYWRERISLGYK